MSGGDDPHLDVARLVGFISPESESGVRDYCADTAWPQAFGRLDGRAGDLRVVPPPSGDDDLDELIMIDVLRSSGCLEMIELCYPTARAQLS